MGIESIVDQSVDKSSGGMHDAMCTACEMAVVWMQNQLTRNQTQEQILDYVNQVIFNLLTHVFKEKSKLSALIVLTVTAAV